MLCLLDLASVAIDRSLICVENPLFVICELRCCDSFLERMLIVLVPPRSSCEWAVR